MEKIGYVCLGIALAAWIVLVIVGLVAAFPVGLIGLVAIAGIGFLLAKVVRERLGSKEDDHYSKNIEK